MEVELSHFKSHTKFSISLNRGATLIKGPSGSGKSAIFEAITWCLYGSIQDIDPWANLTAKTKVTIKFGDIQICRRKRPGGLTVITPKGKFDKPQAQDIIESIFGSKIIWECTGYINEDASNTLFSLTSKQRLSILNVLAFPGNNPEDRIEEISLHVTELKRNYETAKDIYLAYNDEYEEWWKINSEDISVIEQEGIPTFTVKELQQKLKDMNQKMSKLRSEEAKYNMMKKRLTDINTQLDKANTILALKIDVDGLQDKLNKSRHREQLLNNSFYKTDVETHIFSEKDYIKILDQERCYEQCQKVLSQYNLILEDVAEEIVKLRDIVSRANTDFYPLVKRKEELRKQLPSDTPIKPEKSFVWDDVLHAREYESIIKHNNRINLRIARLKLDLTKDQMENIVRNEGNHILIRKKKSLKNKLDDLGIVEEPSHIFTYEELYTNKENEGKRKIIESYGLRKEHFDYIEDVRESNSVYTKFGNRMLKTLSFDIEDLRTATKLEDYSRVYGIKDFGSLIDAINKVKLYSKYMRHIQFQSKYNIDVSSVKDVSDEDMEKITYEFLEIERGLDPLTCPHCSNHVYYYEYDKSLEKVNKIYTDEEKEHIRTKYRDFKTRKEIVNERDKIIEEYGDFPPYDMIKIYGSYESLYKIGKNHTSNLEYIDYSSETINTYINFNKLYHKLTNKGKDFLAEQEKSSHDILSCVTQVGKYVDECIFTSEYIQGCIDQNEKYHEFVNLKKEYDQLEVEDIEEYTGDMSKVKECLNYYRQLKDVIETPKHTSTYMEDCIKQEASYNKYIEVKQEFDSIDIPDKLIVSPEELNSIKTKLRDLENIPLAQKPKYSSDYVRKSIEKTKILDELEQYPYEDSSSNIAIQLKRDKDIQRQQDGMGVLKEELEKELKSITLDDTISQRVRNLNESILQYEEEIDITRLYNLYVDKKTKVDSHYDDLQQCLNKLSKTEELLRIANDTMYQILSASITDININIEKIVSVIFTDPIEIKLRMFKQLKTKNIVKPEVSLEIRYRGGVLNNVKKLSKGERSRVILAVTLALNKLSNIPVFLLDETLAHIDQDMKESVTSILKDYASNRSLAIIAHDVITGLYDNLFEF